MKKEYDVAITVGCFDIYHKGHDNLIKRMLERAEKVMILLHDDESIFELKGHFPVQQSTHRSQNINRLINTFSLIVDSPDPSNALRLAIMEFLEPNAKKIYMRGDDMIDFPGKEYLEGVGIPIEYVPYTKDISTTKIRENL